MAVEKYGIASVIHRHITNNNKDIHRLAAGSLGVINGTARDTANTATDNNKPYGRIDGNISSSLLLCCSVANRSNSIV